PKPERAPMLPFRYFERSPSGMMSGTYAIARCGSALHGAEPGRHMELEEAHAVTFRDAKAVTIAHREVRGLAAPDHDVTAVHGEARLAGEKDEHALRVRVHVERRHGVLHVEHDHRVRALGARDVAADDVDALLLLG